VSFTTYDQAARQQVVAYARAQIGKAYQWLGSGPDAFDCSGLALMAWEQAGLDFPYHQVADMIRYIRGSWSPATRQHYTRHGHVRPPTDEYRDKLELGDLIFVYGDVDEPDSVTHCGIFTGWQDVNGRRRRMMTAAVDKQYGVMETTLDWGGPPSGYGLIGH